MTRLGRFIRRLLQRFLAQYNEGPVTPVRYFEEVRMFRVLNPTPDQATWEHFCNDMLDRAYRDAWTRGYEWCERTWPGPAPEDVRIAELQQHSSSLAKEDAFWRDAMAKVDEPRTARQADEARQIGLRLQMAQQRQRRGIR